MRSSDNTHGFYTNVIYKYNLLGVGMGLVSSVSWFLRVICMMVNLNKFGACRRPVDYDGTFYYGVLVGLVHKNIII